MTWEKAGQFVESDVVEWVEAIWSPKKFKRGKSKPWGKQKVVGQILQTEGEFIKVKVLKSAIIENIIGSELMPHKVGTTITKKTVIAAEKPARAPSLERRGCACCTPAFAIAKKAPL